MIACCSASTNLLPTDPISDTWGMIGRCRKSSVVALWFAAGGVPRSSVGGWTTTVVDDDVTFELESDGSTVAGGVRIGMPPPSVTVVVSTTGARLVAVVPPTFVASTPVEICVTGPDELSIR